MRPTRRPSTPSRSVAVIAGAGRRDRRRVGRVVAADHLGDEGGVGDGVGERTDLVEAAGERDEAVAADHAVGRLDADDAAQRRRLADRPAGVAAEPDGGEPGGHRRRAPAARATGDAGRCRAGCASARTPSSRCSSPWRTRRGWSCRSTTAPAARSRSTTVASYGGRQPSRIRDEHVVGMPRVHMLSFRATGTPASGPGSRPAATAASMAAAAARASSASTRLKAWISAVAGGRWRRGAPRGRRAARAVARRGRRRRCRRAVITPPARGSAGRGSDRRRRRAPRPAPRRGRGPAATTSSRSTLTQRVRLGHRLDVGELELVDVGEVVEHVAELGRRPLDLVGRQLEAGQAGDVDDVGGGDAVGHGGEAIGGAARESRPFRVVVDRPLAAVAEGGPGTFPAMATVTFAGATRTYGGLDHPAVDHLDLEIADGEFLVLVGPSGCGKSTTLRMLAGLEPVDEGAIHIGDRDVTTLPAKDRDIAMVFQSYALYPHMTVAENIGFHLKVKRVPRGRARRAGPRGRQDPRPRRRTSTASRPSCPAGSASGWRWAGRSSASRRCS